MDNQAKALANQVLTAQEFRNLYFIDDILEVQRQLADNMDKQVPSVYFDLAKFSNKTERAAFIRCMKGLGYTVKHTVPKIIISL